MKTLVLYFTEEYACIFFEVEGNYSHLDNTFINSSNENEWDKLLSIIPEDQDKWLDEPTKDWDFFITAGFVN